MVGGRDLLKFAPHREEAVGIANLPAPPSFIHAGKGAQTWVAGNKIDRKFRQVGVMISRLPELRHHIFKLNEGLLVYELHIELLINELRRLQELLANAGVPDWVIKDREVDKIITKYVQGDLK
jgi:hypothetical protein